MDQVTVPRATVEQALEALEELNGWQSLAPPLASQAGRQAAINLRAALEQPEQKDVPAFLRAAFERHAESLGYSVAPDTRAGREGGYWSSHTHLMWETWQAALEQPKPPPEAQTEAKRLAYCAGWWAAMEAKAKQDVPETDCGNMEPAAWIDNTGHPKHRLYRQSTTEKRLYGPLRPLYAAPPTTTTQPEPK
jgi:hypothetical protein